MSDDGDGECATGALAVGVAGTGHADDGIGVGEVRAGVEGAGVGVARFDGWSVVGTTGATLVQPTIVDRMAATTSRTENLIAHP
jgi:hypothetical protein